MKRLLNAWGILGLFLVKVIFRTWWGVAASSCFAAHHTWNLAYHRGYMEPNEMGIGIAMVSAVWLVVAIFIGIRVQHLRGRILCKECGRNFIDCQEHAAAESRKAGLSVWRAQKCEGPEIS